MATLEDIIAASKALDETSANPVGMACSETEKSQNVMSDVKKVDSSDSKIVITEQIVETVTVVESTLDRNSCLANTGKEKVEVGDLSRASNGGTFDSVNKIDINVGVDGSSCGNIASDEHIKDEEGSCTGNGGSSTGDSKAFDVALEKSPEDADGDEYGEGEGNGRDHGFCVGDFVWGKVKSHPWWPGQVYDPADASEFAMKHGREGRLLVAFFGDASCSWCLPSQLKPFVENFNEMSGDSTAKSFVNALESAVEEIGRLVESDLTCKCGSLEERDGRPVVSNAGVTEGVLAPDVDIHRLSVPEFNPIDMLATLKHLATGRSVENVLHLAVLRSSLSAFYHSKGSYPLPVYCEPLEIEGMEAKTENTDDVNNDFSVPIEVPILGPREDDWLVSPSANTSKSEAEDKTYHRRKQKSVAELMGDKPDVKTKRQERLAAKRRKGNDGEVEESGSRGVSLAGKSGKKKKKEVSELPEGSEEVSNSENSGIVDNASKKKKEVPKLPKTATEEAPDAENIAGGDDASKRTSLRKQKKLEVVITEYSMDDAKEGSELLSTPRERKKSKYLSPPYTSPTWRIGSSSFKMSSTKSPREDKLGEQTSKASGHSSMSDDKVMDGNLKETDSSFEATTPTVEEHKKLSIFSSDVDIPLDDLVSDIQVAALDPFYLSNKGSLDIVWAFVSALRSAIYLHGPDHKVFQKCKSRKKRKSLHSGQGNEESYRSHEKAKPAAKCMPEEDKMERKAGKSAAKQMLEEEKTKRKAGKSAAKRMREEEKTDGELGKSAADRMPEDEKTEGKPGKSKSKKATETSRGRSKVEKLEGNISSGFVLEFKPEYPLPSKEEIVNLFSKYGILDEEETRVVTDSHSVQIKYMKDTDAEVAFQSSLSEKPFGGENVISWRFKPSKSRVSHPKVASRKRAREDPESSQPDDLFTDVQVIKQKIEIMSAIVENYHSKFTAEEKSGLKDEMRSLLESVETASERIRVIAENSPS